MRVLLDPQIGQKYGLWSFPLNVFAGFASVLFYMLIRGYGPQRPLL